MNISKYSVSIYRDTLALDIPTSPQMSLKPIFS